MWVRWPFAGRDLRDAPVDVLIVDEAGRLFLADTLAVSMSARNATAWAIRSSSTRSPWRYTGGAGRRSLSTDSEPTGRCRPRSGVFLTETRRMLPDVRRFISHQKLRSSGSATESPMPPAGYGQSLVHQVAVCKNVAGFCPTAKRPLGREMSNFWDTRCLPRMASTRW